MSNLPTSTVQIQTEAVQYRAPVSESLLSNMGGAINFALTNLIPVGTIFPSMLTAAQFASVNGTSDWALADGSAAPVGSTYASLIGATLPDLRGVVLRGKNNGRSTSTGNSAGELGLGTYQADDIKSHLHTVNVSNKQMVADGGTGATGECFDSNSATLNYTRTFNTELTGITENRVRNVTVNYFIKIN